MKTSYIAFLMLFCWACLALADQKPLAPTQPTQLKQIEKTRRINFDHAKNQIAPTQISRTNRPPKPIHLPVNHSRTRSRSLDQGGDDCASATVINSLPFCVTGSTLGYNNDFPEEVYCVGASGGNDVYYRYTPSQDELITISLCGTTSFRTITVLYEDGGDCSGIDNIQCNNNSCGIEQACLQDIQVFGGVSYIIVVDGDWGESGAYVLNVSTDGICGEGFCGVDPPGEDCESAGQLTLVPDGILITGGTTVGADVTCTDDCVWFSQSPDVFYYFTLTECRRIAIKLESGDSHVSVYNGLTNCCGTPILCNDDYGDFSPLPSWDNPAQHPTEGFDSYVAAELAPGTYYIRCGMYDNQEAPFTITIYDNGSCGPTGDHCSNPYVIGGFPYEIVNTTEGRNDDYVACNDEGDGAPDVVFSYTPTQNILVDISTCDETFFNAALTIFRDGDFGNPYLCYSSECVSFANNTLYYNPQIFCALFEVGHSYCIVIDGRNPGDQGYYHIRFNETSVQTCNMNDYCGTPRETEPNSIGCPSPQFDPHIIHCGDTLYGNICGPGDKDYYLMVTGEDTLSLTGVNTGPNCDQNFADIGIAVMLLTGQFGFCHEFAPCNQCSWVTGYNGPDTFGVVIEGMGSCKAGPYKIVANCELRQPEPCDPTACTLASTIPCNTLINANTCNGCNILPDYYVNGTSGLRHSAGKQVYYKLIVTNAGNYTIDVSTDSLAVWNQNVQFMVFTNCTLPKTSCIISQDQNDYFNQVDGTRNTETATVFLTPGTYFIATSISSDYPYGTSCGDLSIQVTCPVCQPADSVVIRWNSVTSRADVTFRAPAAGQYKIYSTISTTLNTIPPGAGWTLETTQNVPVGRTTWTDPSVAVLYKRYLVVHSCP